MTASNTLHLSRLTRAQDTAFDLAPEAAARADLARDLGISGIRKLRFSGRLIPEGARDWRLDAVLGATVVQPCVVTTDPVVTRIDEPVTRRYLADLPEPDAAADEVEMPEDDSVEPLPATLDLGAVLAEALLLALPLYPRSQEAGPGNAVFGPPGVAPMTDEDAKPLAGLAALKDRLISPDDPETGSGE